MFKKLLMSTLLISSICFSSNTFATTKKVVSYNINRFVPLGNSISLLTKDGAHMINGTVLRYGAVIDPDPQYRNARVQSIRVRTAQSNETRGLVASFIAYSGDVQFDSVTVNPGQTASLNMQNSLIGSEPISLIGSGFITIIDVDVLIP